MYARPMPDAHDAVGECRHGTAPVEAGDANPQAPTLTDAAFDLRKARVFVDAERILAIVLFEKVDQSYDTSSRPRSWRRDTCRDVHCPTDKVEQDLSPGTLTEPYEIGILSPESPRQGSPLRSLGARFGSRLRLGRSSLGLAHGSCTSSI